MIREELLWIRESGAPLMVLIPGGTGSGRASTPGYAASARFFWLRGYSCYIAGTAEHDGNPGLFSIVDGEISASPVVTTRDVEDTKNSISSSSCLEHQPVCAANHNLPRGSNPTLLVDLLNAAAAKLDLTRPEGSPTHSSTTI